MFSSETTATPTLEVCEIFTSIQGEGTRIGMPSTFVRLLRCNLRCRWCDTTYSWKEGEIVEGIPMRAEAIADELRAPDVVITGGEPMMQELAPLLEFVGDRHVTIETNATIFEPYDRVDLWSLSPKFGTSGHRPNLPVLRKFLERYRSKLQLKLVIDETTDDLAQASVLLADLPARGVPLILQPAGRTDEEPALYLERVRELAEAVLADPGWSAYRTRVLPQLHRLLWGNRPGT